MLTRFMDELGLDPNGTKLEVCGPITWEDGDVRVDVRFIVRQGSTMVAGRARARAPHDDEWERENVKVPGSAVLVPGLAVGLAVAVLHRADGGSVPLHWLQEVTLHTE